MSPVAQVPVGAKALDQLSYARRRAPGDRLDADFACEHHKTAVRGVSEPSAGAIHVKDWRL